MTRSAVGVLRRAARALQAAPGGRRPARTSRSRFQADIKPFFPTQRPGLVDYVVHVSEHRHFFYVETPKVGCTSIKLFLQLAELDGQRELLPEKVHVTATSPIERLSRSGLSLGEILDRDDYFKFAFVRNPFTRTLSAYLDKMVTNGFERNRLAPMIGLDPKKPIALRAYLEALAEGDNLMADIHWIPQHVLLSPDHIPYDLIGRFERFSEGFDAVSARIAPQLAEEAGSLPGTWHQTGSAEKVSELIGPEERRLIVDLYGDDFHAFAYGLDPHMAAV